MSTQPRSATTSVTLYSTTAHLVHPLDGAHHAVALLLTEDRRSLVHRYLLVGVHPDREVVGERLGLPQGVGVAEVDHVVAAVGPRSDGDPGLERRKSS